MAGMILVKNLVGMGFSEERAQFAVAATDCAGVQPALEWLLKDENERPSTSAAAKSKSNQNQKGSGPSIIPLESSVVTKRLLVDEAWELLDPTPDIHALFAQFSKEFFWDKLGGVEVKWSPRMTTCAGICSFKPQNRECIIALSKPLLSLRPRRDLVETLLHEMIHAYLFLDSGTTDREGHGEQFHSHMYRINRKSGTNITVYHSFNDEVKHYRTHWWKCDGPCQRKPPYFGIVKRAMNRAPGPSDFWHEQHKNECGGTFIKIREPEKEEPKQGKRVKPSQVVPKTNSTVLTPAMSNTRKITDFFPKSPKKSNEEFKQTPIHTLQTIASDKPETGCAPCRMPNTASTTSGVCNSSTMKLLFPGAGRKLND